MKIDFVIPWVDGQDPAWLEEKEKCLAACGKGRNDNGVSDNRFRDWDLLRYWFRAVESYAPWVHRIYFITWGHVPSWLNQDHKKLRVVRHEDFIPEEYLPTFNCNVIQMNLHRIRDLSEHFVLFNDDVFLMKAVRPGDFFKKGIPCDSVLMDAVTTDSYDDIFPHILMNNAAVINRHFVKKEVLKAQAGKFFHYKYGKDVIRNLLVAPLKRFTGFRSQHNPISNWKSTLEELWEKEPQILDATSRHSFRHREDVSDWLLRDWRFCLGQFVPRSTRFCHCFELGDDPMEKICAEIEKPSHKVICLNDSKEISEIEVMKKMLKNSFDHKLGKKSSFEI